MARDIYEILNYPQEGKNEILMEALENLGVELIPFGKKKIFGVPVLGKGWCSLVICGVFDNKKIAVKIQRKDSHRSSLRREASFLRVANKYGIGPTLYFEGSGFLMLEYLEGTPIRESIVKKREVLSFLDQCHVLDELKIDHGQIQGGKHLIVGKGCYIIDFEKAGYRTPRNVSYLISELFLKKTEFAQRMRSEFGTNIEGLIGAVQEYKQDFDLTLLLNALGI